jgi:hypothetical protein
MSASFGRPRLARLGVAVLVATAMCVTIAWDARVRVLQGHLAMERTAAIAHVVRLPGLALSTSSTWLRHPMLAPPSAGVSDGWLGLDVDPAGAVIARPRRHEDR